MSAELPTTMRAMVTEGHGGIEKIVLHEDWPRPDPAGGEVLIRVGACGLNSTDVNTRSGWYSKAVSDATTGDAFDTVDTEALHLAATIPDINCHAFWACQDMLTVDIADGRGPRNKAGHLHLPEEPGLGVEPNENQLGHLVAVYQ